MNDLEDPMMSCPRCGAEHPDHDGLGFVAHVKPGYDDGCGWCSHPSRDGDGKGNMVCGICGDVRPEKERCVECGNVVGEIGYGVGDGKALCPKCWEES